MGGMLNSSSTVTLTGNRTKIIAPITQIFGANINFAGTWEIDRAYPQWFGAVAYTGVNASSVDSAPAINKAIVMKSTGEVFLPRGHYRVNSSIEVKMGIKLIGEPGYNEDLTINLLSTVLVPWTSSSNYTGGYFLRHNVNTAGNNWVVGYISPGTVIRNIFFYNQNQLANMKGLLSAGAIELDTCSWQYFKQAFFDVFLYNDSRKITKCAYRGAATSDSGTALYAFDINSLGDALVFEQNHLSHDAKAKALRISFCNGGSVKSNIINGDILIENCKGITFISNHLEDGAQLVIADSNVTSMNNYFQKGTVPSMKVISNTNESDAPVVKSTGDLFLFYDISTNQDINYNIANISEYDVQIGSKCSLEFSQTYRYWVTSNLIGKMNLHGIALCDNTNTPIADFNEHSYLLSSKGRIMPGYNVIKFDYMNNLSNPAFFGYGHSGNCRWQYNTGTYYYKYQILWDRRRLICGQSGTLSFQNPSNPNGPQLSYITVSQNGPGVLLQLGLAEPNGYQVMIRIYRGTSINYTQYVDVPATGTYMFYDNGISICGFKWKSLTAGENLATLNTNIIAIRYSGRNIECKSSIDPRDRTYPIIGAWQEGDIIYNTNPVPYDDPTVLIDPPFINPAHWIYLSGAWRPK